MNFGKSFQTTIGGIGSLLAGFILLFYIVTGKTEASVLSFALVAGFFSSGWTGLKAKDANVTGAGSLAQTIK